MQREIDVVAVQRNRREINAIACVGTWATTCHSVSHQSLTMRPDQRGATLPLQRAE